MEMKMCLILVSANGLTDTERDVRTLKLLELVGGCLSLWS